MKNKLFWLGALAYFVGDLLTTYIGLSIGAVELNPFIKMFPIMLLAKLGVLMFMFGVFKYIEYLSIKTKNERFGEAMKKIISTELVVLGVGVGVINNILVIGGFI